MGDMACVIELPKMKDVDGEIGFLFSGGKSYPAKIVDWFETIPPSEFGRVSEDERIEMLQKFTSQKVYIKPGFVYVIVCNSGLVVPVPNEGARHD